MLRLLVEGSALPALDGLGLLEVSLEELRHLLTRPAGLVVVGGPAGSGRTTLLNSILRHLERPEISLYSIEDPVTVRLEGVTQVCVDRGAGLDFATALRHVLRHDPDIIMCGEVADGESADLSARAAVTGHLVLASLYALDAASVPRRLLELGLERFWVREALLGATSQRLLRTLCTDCRRERETTAAEADWLRAAGLDEPPGAVYEPVGCPNCRGTGYRGRTLVVEVLVMDDELGRALMECADLREFEALARTHLAPMRRHAAEKVVAGLTSVLEASRVLD